MRFLGEDMNTKIKTQKFSLLDIFKEGWRIYRVNFLNILFIFLIINLPIYILHTKLFLKLIPVDIKSLEGLLPNYLISSIVWFFVGIISSIAITYIVEKTINAQDINWKEALRYALSKWGITIKTGLLVYIILFGLTLLFVVPGFIWRTYYSFWMYVVCLREIGGKSALG
jgi:uncharacterized membrane protein YesL